jgi:putative peptidoglycan lipid II flippase
MNRWLNKANQRVSLTSAATLLLVAALIGQMLGFMRTQIINAQFGPLGHSSTDAYFAAFKIPDFFFYTIAAGALGVAFMPFLADKLEKGDRRAVWELTSSLLNLLGILMAAVGLILLIFTRPLLHIVIGKDLSPETMDHAVTIMRLIALNPLLFTISGILTSLQQTFGRFFFYALAPILYNGCIIASAYIFKGSLGITGLGIGALAGAILQLLIVLFGLYGMRFRYHLKIKWNVDFRRILHQLPPRSIDQGIDGLNSIVETNRASTLGPGFISYYENAYILHTAPILLIGTSIATAAFPRLNLRLSQGRPDLFRRDYLMVLRAMIWIILPVAVISFFTRGYLARIIFKANAPEIALIFGFLSVAIIFRALYAIISRYFYSHKDTTTPLMVSLFAIGLNIFLAFTLVRAYGGAQQPLQAVTGLAIAQSIVAAVEVIILGIIMMWRDPRLFNAEFWAGVVRIFSVTGFTILTTYIMVTLVPLLTTDKGFSTLATKLMLIIIPSLAVHIGISALFGLDEVRPLIKKLRVIVLKPVHVIE